MFRLLFFLFFLFKLNASNFHEHLFSLPFVENIVSKANSIFALPDNAQKLSLFFKSPEQLKAFLYTKWEHQKVDEFIASGGFDKTLSELCHFFPGSGQENLKRILSLDIALPATLRRICYEIIETIRKDILLVLPDEEFLSIYEDYLKNEPLINRKVISATATRRFFETQKPQKLISLCKSYGSRLFFRLSWQRLRLLYEDFRPGPTIHKLIESRIIRGIDLVGSLNEEKIAYHLSKKEIEKKLRSLFDFSSNLGLVLVLHIFEEANNDIFYEALKNVVGSYKKNLYLEIGHLTLINKKWLNIFSSNPKLKCLFHVNAASNMILQNQTAASLKEKIHLLSSYHFPVAIGSDGRGILPGSSWKEQATILNDRQLVFYSLIANGKCF